MILTVKISDQAATSSAKLEPKKCPLGCSTAITSKTGTTSGMIRHLQSGKHNLHGEELLTAMRKFKPDYIPKIKSDSDNDQRYLVQ